MSTGWIKLHRQINDNAFCSRNMERLGFWTYLLLAANHERAEFYIGQQKVVCESGQIVAGRKALALATGLTESKIERFLTCLENEQQIEQQMNSRYRVIKLKNWDLYQRIGQQLDSSWTAVGQQLDTNNNNKKNNNEKKPPPNPPPIDSDAHGLVALWRSYGLAATDNDAATLSPDYGRPLYDPAMIDVCRLYGESRRLVRFMNDLLSKRGSDPLVTFRTFPARNFYELFISVPTKNRRTWRDYVGKTVAFVFEQEDQDDLAAFAKSAKAAEFPHLFPPSHV